MSAENRPQGRSWPSTHVHGWQRDAGGAVAVHRVAHRVPVFQFLRFEVVGPSEGLLEQVQDDGAHGAPPRDPALNGDSTDTSITPAMSSP